MADPTTAPAPTTTTAPAPTGDAGAAPAGEGKGTTQTPPPAPEKTTTLTEGKTTEGQKDPAAGEGKTPSDTAPAGIEIKVPEGVATDPGMLEGFKGVAQELGLKSEQAQKVADWYFKTSQEFTQKAQIAQEQQVVTWAEEAKADKDIGGPNWDANVKIAQSAIRQFGDPALSKLLNETGLGNHKAMIGLFAKIGKAIAEDRMPKGPVSAGDGQKQEVPLEQTLYPTMHPQT
jgi:hypothetical protein